MDSSTSEGRQSGIRCGSGGKKGRASEQSPPELAQAAVAMFESISIIDWSHDLGSARAEALKKRRNRYLRPKCLCAGASEGIADSVRSSNEEDVEQRHIVRNKHRRSGADKASTDIKAKRVYCRSNMSEICHRYTWSYAYATSTKS